MVPDNSKPLRIEIDEAEGAVEIGSECALCAGTGYNAATLELYRNFHSGARWQFELTKGEIRLLFDSGRLWDFRTCPTRDELNVWQREGFGLDVVARHICTQARSMRLGTYASCAACGGEGDVLH